MSNGFENPAWYGTLFFYSQSIYEKLDSLTEEQIAEVTDACQRISGEYPLHVQNKCGEFDKFDIPHFGEKSGPFIIALMGSILVRANKGEGLPDSPVLSACADGYRMCLK